MTTWLLYGANGYTGELIARQAANRGLQPILAGRSAHKIEPLAGELGLRHRAFAVIDAADIAPHLTDVDVVLHCAGPFSATSAPMIEACLRTNTQYLDISGEIEVFERAQGLHSQAQRDGVSCALGWAST